MTNQVKSPEKIADIIKVLNGGVEFYEEAMEKVDAHGVKTVFGRMLSIKKESIEKLQPLAIAETGEYEKDSDIAVTLRNKYTALLSNISTDKDHTFVDQLEEVEDKTLEVIQSALENEQPSSVNMTLMEVLDMANKTHDQMKTLQQTTS